MERTFEQIRPALKDKMSRLFGEGVSFSYPLPEIVGGVRCDSFFLYRSGTQLVRTRPFAKITAAADDGALVLFQDARIIDFANTEKYPFSMKLHYELQGNMTVKEYKTYQTLLYKLYERVRAFAYSDSLTEKEKEELSVYCIKIATGEPVDLLPFYTAVAPTFYKWALPMI